MDCVNHSGVTAAAYCQHCGKALCSACVRNAPGGQIFCEPCWTAWSAAAGVQPPFIAPPPGAPHPALAAVLGLIPGVGAMYNGQFIKGLIHVGIFAGLVTAQTMDISDGLHVFLGLAIAFWVFYQVFDAYKTAKARQYGMPLPDPFGIERTFGGSTQSPVATVPPVPGATPGFAPPGVMPGGYTPVQPVYVAPAQEPQQASPVGAVVLIGLGVIFLLNTMGWWHFHWIGRMWPVVLIGLGLWLFFRRYGSGTTPMAPTNPPEQQ